jgi:hypothetical protein
MDSGVVNDPAYHERMREAIMSLPIVSLCAGVMTCLARVVCI